MKKLIIPVVTASLLTLAGCATTPSGGTTTNTNSGVGTATAIGLNIFKVSVDNRCRNEIQNQQAWRIARYTMTPQQEAQMLTKVCGCVSEKAPQYVTVVDMTNAALDPAYRTQVVANVVSKTLQSCYAEIVK